MNIHAWWNWFPKENTKRLALTGGAIALFGVFEGYGLWDRLGLLLAGLGLLIGAGASYCLLDDPEKRDIFSLKLAARLGFLLIGPGIGLFLWEYRDFGAGEFWWLACVVTAISIGSLIRLFWTHWRKKA